MPSIKVHGLVDKDGELMWMYIGNKPIARIYQSHLEALRSKTSNFVGARVEEMTISWGTSRSPASAGTPRGRSLVPDTRNASMEIGSSRTARGAGTRS